MKKSKIVLSYFLLEIACIVSHLINYLVSLLKLLNSPTASNVIFQQSLLCTPNFCATQAHSDILDKASDYSRQFDDRRTGNMLTPLNTWYMRSSIPKLKT